MRRAIVYDMSAKTPTFHRHYEVTDQEGWRGEEIVCNTMCYAGTYEVIGNNHGRPLPEAIVTPCGREVYRRQTPEEHDSFAGTINRTPGRMIAQGVILPERHARKFGKPCARCFPGERDA